MKLDKKFVETSRDFMNNRDSSLLLRNTKL